jgi:hypothetical protein
MSDIISESLKDDIHSGNGVKADAGKPDWSLLDLRQIEGCVKVLTFGAQKYARDNWKKVPDGKNRYYAALLRHLTAWQAGEKIDPESGMNHLDHAMCNLYFLRSFDDK